ncbi:unnamed protein product [Paramecium sonneborni]|uniref:Uncharacterized protein n=1 Tax=Paramecium sonneborni TaxID=65129 RepID=A0A8S1R6Q0_9CILI|nr:unnamed protein product [Paramecium sonneborni]
MIIGGTINYLFGGKPFPLRVKLNKVVGYYYSEEKELVWNQCEVYDGEQTAIIYIEHPLQFHAKNVIQQQPIMEIFQFKKEDEKVIVDKFKIERFDELENYVDETQIDQELSGKTYYNIKARVISVDLKKTKPQQTQQLYYKVQIVQDITQHEQILMIFENQIQEFQSINLKAGGNYIFYNISNGIYQYNPDQSVVLQQEQRLYAGLNTKIHHIKQELDFVDFNLVNYQNCSKYYNFFGYILKIKASKNKDPQYQILTLISIQKVKVYVLIPHIFCEKIPIRIEQDQIYGFKNVKIIKYSYRYVLLFNGFSSLIQNLNILSQNKFLKQDFQKYTKLQFQMQCKSLEDVKSGFIDKECYYVKAKIKSIQIEPSQNTDQINLIVVFQNTNNSEIIVRVDRHKHIVKILSVDKFITESPEKTFNIFTRLFYETILQKSYGGQNMDFVIEGFKSNLQNENQPYFKMVKIVEKSNIKRIKQE